MNNIYNIFDEKTFEIAKFTINEKINKRIRNSFELGISH
jgi:hypothetical protein